MDACSVLWKILYVRKIHHPLKLANGVNKTYIPHIYTHTCQKYHIANSENIEYVFETMLKKVGEMCPIV